MIVSEIDAIVLDVDGVLTDGGVYWGPNGEEWKRFCFSDIMGVSLAMKAGIIVSLMSGEDSPLVDRYAQKFGIVDVEKGCKDKAAAVAAFASRRSIDLSRICFMGDDVNDVEAMKLCGLSAAPRDARPSVLRAAAFISERGGGQGAVRDLIDAVLAARGQKAFA